MPRRPYKKIGVEKDKLYKSAEVAKLINYIMRDGKKSVAEKMVYKALAAIKEDNPVDVLKTVIRNVAPTLEVKPKRVGGASYLVPVETRPTRRIFLAFNWLIEGAQSRSNKEYASFDKKLAAELKDAYKGEGGAIAKKKQIEKLAEANRAFAHFKW